MGHWELTGEPFDPRHPAGSPLTPLPDQLTEDEVQATMRALMHAERGRSDSTESDWGKHKITQQDVASGAVGYKGITDALGLVARDVTMTATHAVERVVKPIAGKLPPIHGR